MIFNKAILFEGLKHIRDTQPKAIIFTDKVTGMRYNAAMLIIELKHNTKVGNDFYKIMLELHDTKNSEVTTE